MRVLCTSGEQEGSSQSEASHAQALVSAGYGDLKIINFLKSFQYAYIV